MSIHYVVKPLDLHAHLFQVRLTVSSPYAAGQCLSLPDWIPGSYMIRDFSRNIVTIEAESNGQAIELRPVDKSSWQASPVSGALTVTYLVYAWELSVRAAHCDQTHAYFNGTSLYLMADGHENQPCHVELQAPDGDAFTAWRVATSLSAAEIDERGFGRYMANDYDELIDHPVEMGTFSEARFNCAGKTHLIAITGNHRADMERLCSDLEKICNSHISMFGEMPEEIDTYVFQVMAVGEGYGGLEHRSSTSLLCSRNDLPLRTDKKMTESYRTFLGLCSHEYFHTWNVKRIKPAEFIPYDLKTEVYTRQLWAFEGITSYYDDLALIRSGVIDVKSYLELLGQVITRVLRIPGRHLQSVAESSFYAWNKFYKQDENAPNAMVSYYAKGSLIALSLDLLIRKNTHNQKSLDDVMRTLWLDYGKQAKGLQQGEIETVCEKVSGMDLSDFFARYVYGTEDPPLQEQLSEFGIQLKLRATDSVDDQGGSEKVLDNIPSLGARVAADPSGAKLTQVFSQSSAQQAGLSANDVIIAVNNVRVSKTNLEKIVSSYMPGDTLRVHAFRRDELMYFDMVLQAADMNTCYLQPVADMNETQKQNLTEWLKQGTW